MHTEAVETAHFEVKLSATGNIQEVILLTKIKGTTWALGFNPCTSLSLQKGLNSLLAALKKIPEDYVRLSKWKKL